jgi:hypothetical protein
MPHLVSDSSGMVNGRLPNGGSTMALRDMHIRNARARSERRNMPTLL